MVIRQMYKDEQNYKPNAMDKEVGQIWGMTRLFQVMTLVGSQNTFKIANI